MKKVSAVYTVELALIMPIVLAAIFLPLHEAIKLHSEVKLSSECRWDKEIDAAEQLRSYRELKDLTGRN